jgi:hypothetical protein
MEAGAMTTGIKPEAVPTGTGCVECDAQSGWWVHLRRCAECGHIGCCDSSPGKHATAHYSATGHPIMASFEPGEEWFWDYRSNEPVEGEALAPPSSRPLEQASPGPADRLPADWREKIS